MTNYCVPGVVLDDNESTVGVAISEFPQFTWRVFIRPNNRMQVIRVVHVVDPHDGHEYYIGVGQGYDEQDDILYIAAFGSKFPVDAGNLLFGVSNDRA